MKSGTSASFVQICSSGAVSGCRSNGGSDLLALSLQSDMGKLKSV